MPWKLIGLLSGACLIFTLMLIFISVAGMQ